MAKQREIQALDRLRAFLGELRPDARFILEAGYLVATGAAVEPNEVNAAVLQLRVVQVVGIRVRVAALLGH